MSQKYDFEIIGSGLAGSVLARELQNAGASVIIFEKRNHKGGNLYTSSKNGIIVHEYGAHIMHTNDPKIWAYINKYTPMENFINTPMAVYNNELYNLPINMNTLHQLYGVISPEDAKEAVKKDCIPCEQPQNLEKWALSTTGKTIYEKLIKKYTEKQWGKCCTELPASTIKRIPIRYTYDNSYFNDKWQGVPKYGYNYFIENLIGDAPVILNVDFNKNRDEIKKMAEHIIYTGSLDTLFDDDNRVLEYRSLMFTHQLVDKNNVQGVAVVNYTDDRPYTRTIEHKHFLGGDNKNYSIVTYETPCSYSIGINEPYYPVETEENMVLYKELKQRAYDEGYILCGRLAEYKYYDMDDTIASALQVANEILRSVRK